MPPRNNLIMSGTSIRSFRHLEHQNPSSKGEDNFLVPFLAAREAVAPLENDPIMSGTSIRSFRHLKHQNLSTGYDFIHISRIIFLVPLLATMEVVAPLANDPIMSRRGDQFGRLDTFNVKIHLLFQIL